MKRKKAPAVDISLSAEALGLPFSEESWEATPTEVRHFIIEREGTIIEHEKTIAKLSERVEKLERQVEELLNRDSFNSDQLPSSDGPYRKPRASKKKEKKPQRKKGHPRAKQQLLEPTEEHHIYPEQCKCGCCEFEDIQRYYIHQHIELPIIPLEVSHFHLGAWVAYQSWGNPESNRPCF
ncbi:MAG: hypothetical protein JRI45_02205 [Deltaproteobacteria bacterium]|nr:hypothetical protein [Deltaproteobacteria bacterium]MBW2068848.1 hypothetical protein [Deltaproteobacteria bacterium]